MSNQSNHYSSTGAGKNERENDSQEKNSQNQVNTSNENRKHYNRGRNYHRNANDISPNFHFEGVKPELGGVLTLHTEKVKKKLTYQLFKDKLTNYVMKKMDWGKDLQISILNLKDQFEEF